MDANPANGTSDCLENGVDYCPDDNLKTLPGVCGCGVPDFDGQPNGVVDCLEIVVNEGFDFCPEGLWSGKSFPGVCGCWLEDADGDSDGIPRCVDPDEADLDYCPDDPNKTKPGICGCGVVDADGGNIRTDCVELVGQGFDYCPKHSEAFPHVCGCGNPDDDANSNGVPDCVESQMVPAVSTWGLITMPLLLMVAGTMALHRKRFPPDTV